MSRAVRERRGVARRQARVFLRHEGSERDRSHTSLRTPNARVIFFARPENGLSPSPRRLRSDATPIPKTVQTRVFQSPHYPEDPAMLSLHPVSRKVMRLGIAACGLAALAACGDNSLTGLPIVDLNLSRVAGFDQLKAALVQA